MVFLAKNVLMEGGYHSTKILSICLKMILDGFLMIKDNLEYLLAALSCNYVCVAIQPQLSYHPSPHW